MKANMSVQLRTYCLKSEKVKRLLFQRRKRAALGQIILFFILSLGCGITTSPPPKQPCPIDTLLIDKSSLPKTIFYETGTHSSSDAPEKEMFGMNQADQRMLGRRSIFSITAFLLVVSVVAKNSFRLLNTGLDDKLDHFVSLGFTSMNQNWEWEVVPTPFGKELIADCKFLSPNDGWFISTGGSIAHWNGSDWKSYTFLGEKSYLDSFSSLEMVTPTNGWIVGSGGLILHWDGTEWKRFISPTNRDLSDVSFTTEDLGFASGGGENPKSSEITQTLIMWNGIQWEPDHLPGEGKWYIRPITVASKQSAWASILSSLYFWNGKEWSAYTGQGNLVTMFHNLSAFASINPSNIWAVGTNTSDDAVKNGVIIQWNGSKWNKVIVVNQHLTSIRMFSENLGWAVGHLFPGEEKQGITQSIILYWNGKKWDEFPYKTDFNLSKVCGSDPQNVWIAGFSRKDFMFEPLLLKLAKRPDQFQIINETQTPTNSSIATLLQTSTLPKTSALFHSSTAINTAIPIPVATLTPITAQEERQSNVLIVFFGILSLFFLFAIIVIIKKKS